MIMNLYKSLIRLIAKSVWKYYLGTILQQSIEKIQRRATKLLAGLYDTPYSEIIISLIPSLNRH